MIGPSAETWLCPSIGRNLASAGVCTLKLRYIDVLCFYLGLTIVFPAYSPASVMAPSTIDIACSIGIPLDHSREAALYNALSRVALRYLARSSREGFSAIMFIRFGA